MFKIKKNIKTLFPLSDKDNAELCRKYNIKYIKPEPVKMRKCIRCGKENNADAFFCSGCGYEMKKTVNHNALKQNVNTNNTAPKQPFQSPQNMPNNNAIPNNQKTSVQKQPFQNPQNMPNNNAMPNNRNASVQKQPFQNPQNMPNNNAMPNNRNASVQKQPFRNARPIPKSNAKQGIPNINSERLIYIAKPNKSGMRIGFVFCLLVAAACCFIIYYAFTAPVDNILTHMSENESWSLLSKWNRYIFGFVIVGSLTAITAFTLLVKLIGSSKPCVRAYDTHICGFGYHASMKTDFNFKYSEINSIRCINKKVMFAAQVFNYTVVLPNKKAAKELVQLLLEKSKNSIPAQVNNDELLADIPDNEPIYTVREKMSSKTSKLIICLSVIAACIITPYITYTWIWDYPELWRLKIDYKNQIGFFMILGIAVSIVSLILFIRLITSSKPYIKVYKDHICGKGYCANTKNDFDFYYNEMDDIKCMNKKITFSAQHVQYMIKLPDKEKARELASMLILKTKNAKQKK